MCSKFQAFTSPPLSGHQLLLQCCHLLCSGAWTGQALRESVSQCPSLPGWATFPDPICHPAV